MSVLTKEDLKEVIQSFGIEKGDVVLLQAHLSRFANIIQGYQSLIDAIQETITSEGCLIVPSFTYSCLDPACQTQFAYQDWYKVRKEMKGYDCKRSKGESYKELNAQFYMYNPTRSNHPVYSFSYWGSFEEDCLKQSINDPISFQTSLKFFVKRKAFNILIGESKEKSLLVPAIAHTMNMGTTNVQRAYISNGNKNYLKTYLNLSVSKEETEQILNMCYIREIEVNKEKIYCVAIQK